MEQSIMIQQERDSYKDCTSSISSECSCSALTKEGGTSSRSGAFETTKGYVETEFGFVKAYSSYDSYSGKVTNLTILSVIRNGTKHERIYNNSYHTSQQLAELCKKFASEVFAIKD